MTVALIFVYVISILWSDPGQS